MVWFMLAFFKICLFTYLFIGCVASSCHLGFSLAAISHCGSFSCCRVWLHRMWDSVVVAWGPTNASPRALEPRLKKVRHGFSCFAACRIFLGQGYNLSLPALVLLFFTSLSPREVHVAFCWPMPQIKFSSPEQWASMVALSAGRPRARSLG